MVALTSVAVATAMSINLSGSLTWDEAVYASRSRSLVTDIPATGFGVYRPPGLPVIGLLAAPAEWSAASLRTIALVAGLLALIAFWALARFVFGAMSAIIALVFAVGSPVVLLEARRFHNDLPAVGLLLLIMIVLWDQFETRPRPTKVLLVVAPLIASTFYVRYGALPAICGIVIASTILWPRKIWYDRKLVAVAAISAVVLLVPHIVESQLRTGSPLGILSSAARATAFGAPPESAWQYIRWLPTALAGTGSLLVAAAIVIGIARLREGGGSWQTRSPTGVTWVLVPAAVAWVIVILASHPERRFVLFPVLLITTAASGTIAAWLRRWLPGPSWRGTALVLVGVLIAQVGAIGYQLRRQVIAAEEQRAEQQWMVEAGQFIDADAEGACMVVTAIPPPIGWSSKCLAIPFADDPSSPLLVPTAGPTYVVFSNVDIERYSRAVTERYRHLGGSLLARVVTEGKTTAEIYRLAP